MLAFAVSFMVFIGFSESVHQHRTKLIDLSKLLSLEATNPCNFVLYKQCDSRWASQPLGTSKTETICSAGCAMTSYNSNIFFFLIKPNYKNTIYYTYI